MQVLAQLPCPGGLCPTPHHPVCSNADSCPQILSVDSDEDMESAFSVSRVMLSLCLFFIFLARSSDLRGLSSGTRNLTHAMIVKASDSNQWTTRQLPSWVILCGIFQKQICRGTGFYILNSVTSVGWGVVNEVAQVPPTHHPGTLRKQ